MEPQDRHPAGQGIRQFRHQEDIRGTGEQEPPRPAVAIHRHFEGKEQVRHALDLIEDGPLPQVGEESRGIRPGRLQEGVVIEGDVVVPQGRANRTGKRALAALPGAVHQHHRGILQGLDQSGGGEPGMESGDGHTADCNQMFRLVVTKISGYL